MRLGRHLKAPILNEPTELGLAGLDDLLDRGDLDDWAGLIRAVSADPWGALAGSVLLISGSHPMYGTSTLWTTWIEGLRQDQPQHPAGRDRSRSAPQPAGLAELRRSRGLPQGVIAQKLGISQSDVSKLERRTDARLSTLSRYVEATGGRLRMMVSYDDQEEVEVVLPNHGQSNPSATSLNGSATKRVVGT
ncbi:MAG: helix-turn-helix domain-containing protein [Actinomycetota bacterium]